MSLPAAHQCLVKPFGGGAGGLGSQIGGGNQTIGTVMQIPLDTLWLRFRFACWSAEDVPVAHAVYSATAAADDGYGAVDAGGALWTGGWMPISFGGTGGCLEQLALDGPERAARRRDFVLLGVRGDPAGHHAPQIVCSDWLPVTPLPRRDGGAGALIAVRLFVPAGRPAFKLDHAAAPAAEFGFGARGSYAFGDHAVAPFGGRGHEFPVSAVHGLDAICARPVRTLMVVGDSIGAGDYSTGGGSSYGLAAARMLSAAGLPTVPAIFANPLQTTRCFIGNGYRGVAAEAARLAGSVMVIQCWSGNDAVDAATVREGFGAAIALAEFCRGHGIVPVLATAAPVAARQPAAEACRRQANALVREAGLACLDVDDILGTGARPNDYRPGLAAWDGVHPSDAGQLAVAEVLAALVRRLVS